MDPTHIAALGRFSGAVHAESHLDVNHFVDNGSPGKGCKRGMERELTAEVLADLTGFICGDNFGRDSQMKARLGVVAAAGNQHAVVADDGLEHLHDGLEVRLDGARIVVEVEEESELAVVDHLGNELVGLVGKIHLPEALH